MEFRLSGAIKKDEEVNVFVSYCQALKIYSQGRTEEEAKQAITSAVTLFLSVCYQRGILDKTLRERGFGEISTSGFMPISESLGEFIAVREAKFRDTFEFNVPLSLVAQRELSNCQQ